ncbi:MAG: hypothetical protein H0W78_04670 [Planctomycetes bacterium]|nr:hypothetical protein [Planctomycetota bacterium]
MKAPFRLIVILSCAAFAYGAPLWKITHDGRSDLLTLAHILALGFGFILGWTALIDKHPDTKAYPKSFWIAVLLLSLQVAAILLIIVLVVVKGFGEMGSFP